MTCPLPRTTESILRDLKDYAERVLTPRFLLDLDERGEFPHQVLRDLYDPALLGLHLLFIPKQYGGMGASAHDVCRVSEALAGIDLGIATGLLATFLGTDPLLVGGTEAQKQRWMTRIAREGLLVACAATEAQAGSDLAAMQTRAEPVLEEGKVAAYRLTGRKQSITNGSVAALYTVLALAPGGPSWFLVQRNAEGLSHGKPENKHGIRASNTSALLLDGVVVPSEALLGEVEGRGLEQAQSVFGYTRLMVAAFGLGAGLAALRKAVEYSRVRVQGGSALSEKQAFTHKLTVPNLVRLEAARAYIEWTAGRFDAGGESVGTEGSVAKYLATEAGNRAAEDAIQALGRCGYAREYGVEKLKRDVRITTIYEGTSEMLEWTIARDRWQEHLKSQGRWYLDWAERLEGSDASAARGGSRTAALALRSLATILERCRRGRLTRNQHVLFRLGELIAVAEAAAVFCERCVTHPSRALGLGGPTVETLARICARDAAAKVAGDGLRWTLGAGEADPGLADAAGLPAICAAQTGLLEDMNLVAGELSHASLVA